MHIRHGLGPAQIVIALFAFSMPANAQGIVPQPEGSGGRIEYKRDVRFDGVHAVMHDTWAPVAETWEHCAPGITPVITSARDDLDSHKLNSWHRYGRAADIRGKNLSPKAVACIAEMLPKRLAGRPQTYVLLWEQFPDFPARNHFHLQAPDPAGRPPPAAQTASRE